MTETPPTAAGPRRPYFALHAFVCCNRRPDGHPRGCCASKGSERLRDYMKARAKELGIPSVRINSAGCLDRCELGPCVVLYPHGDWLRVSTVAEADRVLAACRAGEALPADLLLDPG